MKIDEYIEYNDNQTTEWFAEKQTLKKFFREG